jgi:cytochrome c biogenesis protein CcmG, thiol:disulfide interchange protein DsbE
MLRFGLLLALGLSLAASAAQPKFDTLSAGTQTYTNVTVIGANATDLYFTFDQGVANVKLKYLSPALQKRFNYDARLAAEAEATQQKLDALYQSQLASNLARSNVKQNSDARGSAAQTLADPVSDKSLLGKPLAFKVQRWSSTEPVLANRWVLVCFWTPWSVPSRSAIGGLNELQKKFGEKLTVFGVVPEAEADQASAVEPKPDYAMAVDVDGKLAAAAGVTSVPTVLLLDPQGLLLYSGHPAAVTEKKLAEILARQQ